MRVFYTYQKYGVRPRKTLRMMAIHRTPWFKNAIVYAIDIELFQDANGDGIGDFEGLTARLDYLSHLGVDCLWLLPFYPSPNRDNGYDVADYYGIDPRHGTLGDFVEFVQQAKERGIHILIDLVVNHTSDEHPWFQKSREGDEQYRDYYIWTDEPWSHDPERGSVFPGEVADNRIWTWDDMAGAYYYHRFYEFQPDLNLANPDVRKEIRKIVQYWLQLGVDGFRLDAAGLMVQEKRPGPSKTDDTYGILRDLRSYAARYRGDVVLMGEADVSAEDLPQFTGPDKLDLLLNFLLNARLFHAFAVERSEPLEDLFQILPELPGGSWANFLRNHDELNIGSLRKEDKQAVFERFAPDENMRIYDRGIRRRLAPMLDGDKRRIELAFSLLFSLPGAPLLVYGDEIGMGDDLSLSGRTAVRTPMQWSDTENGGFSPASADDLVRPVIDEGPFGYEDVNVVDAWATKGSLLNFVEHLIGTRHEVPELAQGELTVLDIDVESVFAHRVDHDGTTVLAMHNLTDEPVTAPLNLTDAGETLLDLLGTGDVRQLDDGRLEVDLAGYDYRWVRLER